MILLTNGEPLGGKGLTRSEQYNFNTYILMIMLPLQLMKIEVFGPRTQPLWDQELWHIDPRNKVIIKRT